MKEANLSLLEIKEVHKYFGNLHVLKGISLKAQKGECVVIMGPSGSGKSTLLRCVNYIVPFDSGIIEVNGVKLLPHTRVSRKLLKLREEIGFVFQSFNLFPHLSALDNVSLALKIVKKKSKDKAEEIANYCLEQVGLKDKISSYPDQLSGGQQQRVAIARCLAMNPKLMLLDEITSALDPELIAEVIEVLEEVTKLGITMLIVTHEINFARKSGDKVCFFYDGIILEEGPPEQIFNTPKTEPAKRFFKALS
jgi:ABC-type polar amino acid transport system ATPase subunit